jgi:hypothetical protein
MLLRCEIAEALRKWMPRERLPQAQAAKQRLDPHHTARPGFHHLITDVSRERA